MNFFNFNEKTRKTVHMLSGIVAVTSFIAAIFLHFFANTLIIKGDPLLDEDTTIEASSHNPPVATRINYTFFLDTRVFSKSVDGKATTVQALKDENTSLTIIPLHGTSYFKLCTDTEQYAEQIYEYAELNVDKLYSVYRTTADGVITTIYCIDDGTGSSIEIKYMMAENDKKTEEDFNILLSMFKLIY